MLALVLYIASVVAANWAVVTFGVVPVGFGLVAPAAVYVVGLTFTIRDFIPRRRMVWTGIVIGALLSAFLSPQLALASALAFAVSETADFITYNRLRRLDVARVTKRANWVVAIVGSNIVGLALDSVIFLSLAFGSLAFLPGQIVGKLAMTALAIPVVWVLRQVRGDRRYFTPPWPPIADEIRSR